MERRTKIAREYWMTHIPLPDVEVTAVGGNIDAAQEGRSSASLSHVPTPFRCRFRLQSQRKAPVWALPSLLLTQSAQQPVAPKMRKQSLFVRDASM
eukprot:538170-Rhodomonas_salina.2